MSQLSKVVILTTRGGEGLVSGAIAIKEALHKSNPQLQIEIIDFFSDGGSILGSLLTKFYNFLLRHSLRMNAIYIRFMHRLRIDRWTLFYGSTSRKFKQILSACNPDMIIVTSQYIIAPICFARSKYAQQIPIVIGNIDPAPPSSLLWFDERADLHLLPTEDAMLFYQSVGMPVERSARVKLSVRDRFISSASFDRTSLRSELGFDSHKPLLLLTGSREGYFGMKHLIMRILEETNSQVAVICGTNKKFEKDIVLLSSHFKDRIRTYGWRDDIERFMRASDLIISKPGKQTMKESLATGTPLLALTYPAVMEQEEGNLEFLRKHDVALEATSEDSAIEIIARLLSDKDLLGSIQKKIHTCSEKVIDSRTIPQAIYEHVKCLAMNNIVHSSKQRINQYEIAVN